MRLAHSCGFRMVCRLAKSSNNCDGWNRQAGGSRADKRGNEHSRLGGLICRKSLHVFLTASSETFGSPPSWLGKSAMHWSLPRVCQLGSVPQGSGADRQEAHLPWHIAVGAQRPPLNRTPALQQPIKFRTSSKKYWFPISDNWKCWLGPMHADNADLVVLREKRSDMESDLIRALGNKIG